MKNIGDYTLRVWLISIVIGMIGILIINEITDQFYNFFSLQMVEFILGFLFGGMIYSLPLYSILLLGNLAFGKFISDVTSFKIMSSGFTLLIWGIIIYFLAGRAFFEVRPSNLLYLFPHLIGWLFGIWFFTIESKVKRNKLDAEDILDTNLD